MRGKRNQLRLTMRVGLREHALERRARGLVRDAELVSRSLDGVFFDKSTRETSFGRREAEGASEFYGFDDNPRLNVDENDECAAWGEDVKANRRARQIGQDWVAKTTRQHDRRMQRFRAGQPDQVVQGALERRRGVPIKRNEPAVNSLQV
jgi:hypothetical protein